MHIQEFKKHTQVYKKLENSSETPQWQLKHKERHLMAVD